MFPQVDGGQRDPQVRGITNWSLDIVEVSSSMKNAEDIDLPTRTSPRLSMGFLLTCLYIYIYLALIQPIYTIFPPK